MRETPLSSGMIVPTDRIDAEDRTFALTPPWLLQDPRLTRAIAKVGVQQPLLLQSLEGGRYRIVSGFKRHHAARGLGFAVLPAFLAGNEGDAELFLKTLCDNLGVRTLSPLEEGEAVARLKAFGVSVGSLLDEVLPLLGFPSSRRHLERLFAIAALPSKLKRALTDRLRIDVALALAAWRSDERDLFVGLVDDFRLGINKQKELFELLDELKRARGDDAVNLWQSSGAASRAEDRGLSPNQRFAAVKEALRRLRFPLLSEHEARFEVLERELDLPSGVRLAAPPYFEGTRIRLELTAGSVDELKRSLQELGNAAAKRAMREIFDLL